MNSIHYSKATTAALAVLVLLAAAGTASAFDVSAKGVPSESQVGTEVTVTYTIDGPFTNVSNVWTMRGSTDLRNVNWTVQEMFAGSPISNGTTYYDQPQFSQTFNATDGADTVKVRLTGDVPPVGSYSYEPKEQFLVAQLERETANESSVFVNDTAHHYTPASKNARIAIRNASQAIEEAPGNQTKAKADLKQAKRAYAQGNFQLAQSEAADARNKAQSAKQSAQQFDTILMVAGAVILLALIGGGVYYWRSQEEEYSKL